MKKKKILIIGCGGHAKSVCDSLLGNLEYQVVGFIDREENLRFSYNEISCIGTDDDLSFLYQNGIHYAALGIGYLGEGTIREDIVHKLENIGFQMPAVIDASAVIAKSVSIGKGVFIGKGAVINANAKVGKYCIINSGTIVEHDASIKEWSHIAVRASVCGEAQIGSRCFVGAGAIVAQTICVADNAIIGAGAVVIQNVLPNTVSVGIPAKTIKKEN